MLFFKNRLLQSFIILLLAGNSYAKAEPATIFPLQNYNQSVSQWINPKASDYDKPLFNEAMQKRHLDNFHKKYLSPWDKIHVQNMIEQPYPDDIRTIQREQLNFFSNKNKSQKSLGYGENFKPYKNTWIENIRSNIHLDSNEIKFNPKNRAIAIDNLQGRQLPTEDVHFYDRHLAGEGYPFDNLQVSAVWAGTPLYIIEESKDHEWSLVLTPDFIAWVKSKGIARASDHFIMMWVHQTRRELSAIVKSNSPILNDQKQFQFMGYVGMVFPSTDQNKNLRLSIPVANEHHEATIEYVTVSKKLAHQMPLTPTPRHFATLVSTLIERPYGWGNLYFYNDCSSELKSLYAPFGIWLPRNADLQTTAGKSIDLSDLSPKKRIEYLKNHGRKLMTITYINGHVFLYVGTFKNPHSKHKNNMVVTYQEVWGLHGDEDSITKRFIIGQSAFIPLLLNYPESAHIKSQAARSIFKIAYLNEPADYVKKPKRVNLRNIMH